MEKDQVSAAPAAAGSEFQLESFEYELPAENIAQHPASRRDQSRLLVLNCRDDSLEHERFEGIINYISPGDLLVVNDSRVFPARFFGHKATGGKVEMFLLHYPLATDEPAAESTAEPAAEPADEPAAGDRAGAWRSARVTALLKSSKRPGPGAELFFSEALRAEVLELGERGEVELTLRYRLEAGESLDDLLGRFGNMPLPPYISRPEGTSELDAERYQTRYARQVGSVAAPTAGLHFSDELLAALRDKAIAIASVTLHVGYGTFAPVRAADIREHRIHAEHVEVPARTAELVNRVKAAGGRIWAVGTTTVRSLEAATDEQGVVQPLQGLCDLFIYPGYRFKTVDNLITNFHLPRSSLLFLVSALAGRERIMSCYREAIARGYRFYSYGDAMAIIVKPAPVAAG